MQYLGILAGIIAVNGEFPPPLTEWVLDRLDLACGFSENTVLSFQVYPADVNFDTSNFRVGDCTQDDITFTKTAVDASEIAIDQQELGRALYTVSYNPQTCLGITADPANIASYASTVTFDFDFGYVVSGTRMHMRTYRIPAICRFDSQYDIRFDFGMLERPIVTVSPDGDVEQPVYGGLGFNIRVFKDSDLTEEVYQTETNMKGGKMAYFTIEPDRALPSDLRFTPPSCRFVNEACDDQLNCNELMGYDLFHFQQHNCGQPQGSPLNFELSYVLASASDEKNKWNSQFRLFLFNNDVDESTYVLRCRVEICVAACEASQVVGDQMCNTIAGNCLNSSNFLEFNNQC